MRNRRHMLAYLLITSITVSACAGAGPQISPAVPSQFSLSSSTVGTPPATVSSRLNTVADPDAAIASPVAVPEVWAGGTVRVLPPGGLRPAISVADALATCTTGQSVCGPTAVTPTVRLGVGTSFGAGTASADGSLRPLFDHALVYEIIWLGIDCVTSPDTPNANGAPVSITMGKCTIVSWVDATSGKALYGLSGAGI